MLGSLLKGGMEITNEAANADVVIVNTCSFIEAAQQESIDAILESDVVRCKTNPRQGLIVSGCLPQRFREDLPKLLPEVDAFMGIDQVAQVSEIVEQALTRRQERLASGNGPAPRTRVKAKTIPARLPDTDLVNVHQRPTYIPDFATPRYRLTPKHFAY